jgi:hypothetical protein
LFKEAAMTVQIIESDPEHLAEYARIPIALTNMSGVYKLTVSAGTYCVDVSPDPVGYSHTTDSQTVTVVNGGSVNDINFGYWIYLGIR